MATIDKIKEKYSIQNDANEPKKYYSVIVRFEGVSKESVRASSPAEAEKLASNKVLERSTGVYNQAKVSIKRAQAKEDR